MHSTDSDIRNRLLLARLPAMPEVLLKLMALCQNDDAGMAELAELVACDAAVSTRVMSVANSAAYRRAGQSSTLLQALNALGANMLKTLVINEAVYQTLNGFPHAGGIDLRAFWKHSLSTAVIAREIATAMAQPQTEEIYLAGLLHDVGRLALLAAEPNVYSTHFMASDSADLCQTEQRALQIDHAEAGAWLIERWNLDAFLADAVLYHHEPASRLTSAHPMIRIVHLAHTLADQAPDAVLPAGAGALCQLSDDTLQRIQQQAEPLVERAAAQLGLDLTTPPAPRPAPLGAAAPALVLQQQLAEEVGTMTLATELAQALARPKETEQLLATARQSARILFDLEQTVVLLLDEAKQVLSGAETGAPQQRLAQFSIALAGGGGIAESALQKQLAFLGRDRSLPGLPEEQLLRILGEDCLLSLPLCQGARCLGVLVAGIPAWRIVELKKREKLLQAFGAKLAQALHALTQDRSAFEGSLAEVRAGYIESSRRVAHEVNNPLTIIKNYLSVLDDKVNRHEAVTGELSIIHEEIDRVGGLVREFAGAQPRPQTGRTDLNRIIGDMVRLFRESRFLPSTVQITAQLPAQACDISSPADTLKQILMNLVKNAIEALPAGGQIELINAGRVHHDGQVYCKLCVRDNGAGLPEDVLTRLFSPVASAKAGENRGIGLSIVHDLVKKQGGRISCASSASGTSFDVLLPVAGAPHAMEITPT